MALKDYNNLLCVVTKHKEMELYVLYNTEFKIAVLRKLSYKKTYRQFSEIKKTIHNQNEKFSKEIEIIKMNQTQSWRIHENEKNAIKIINSRIDQIEEKKSVESVRPRIGTLK